MKAGYRKAIVNTNAEIASNIFEIKLLFTFKKWRKKAVNQFIGQSLSLMNVVVEEDKPKCEKYLRKLQKIEPRLFKIISDFDKQWAESADLDLATTFLNFEYELNEWLVENKITAEHRV